MSEWIGLAATPTFAIAALLTALGGKADALCSASHAWTGMVSMYLLMSAFHAAPWMRLISGRRRAARLP